MKSKIFSQYHRCIFIWMSYNSVLPKGFSKYSIFLDHFRIFFFFCIATQQIPRYTSNFLYFGIINTLGWMILCWECCLCNVGCFKASWLTSPLMPVALPQLWQPESVHTFLNIFWGSKTATIQEHTLLNLLNLHILLNSVPNTPYTRGAITTSLYFITYK